MEWERRFETVTYTPIRDMPFGSHLDFLDPDGTALEFMVPDAVLVAWQRELCERDVPREEINARVREHLLASGVPESERPSSIAAAAG
jgi:hypothetical protein